MTTYVITRVSSDDSAPGTEFGLTVGPLTWEKAPGERLELST
jgi:hypothetical protein